MGGSQRMTSRTVRMVDSPPASGVVSGIISACQASSTVGYRIVDVRDCVATVTITGPADDVERVYNYGVSDRVW